MGREGTFLCGHRKLGGSRCWEGPRVKACSVVDGVKSNAVRDTEEMHDATYEQRSAYKGEVSPYVCVYVAVRSIHLTLCEVNSSVKIHK